MSNTEINLITFAVTLTVLIVGFVYQWVREVRLAHRLETAAEEVARQLAETTAKVAETLEQNTLRSTEAYERNTVALHAAITEGNQISTRAFHEANTVNLKLEALGLKQQDIERLQLAAEKRDKKKP